MWLYLAIALPSLFMVVLNLSSMAGGMAIASMLVVFGLIAYRNDLRFARAYLIFLAVAATSICLSILIFDYPGIGKQIFSIPLVIAFGLAYSFIYGRLLTEPSVLKKQIKVGFILASLFGFAAAFNLTNFLFAGRNRPTFPFSEPSHFALAYAIFVIGMAMLQNGYKKWIIVLSALVLAALFPNTTLLMVALLMAVLFLNKPKEYLALGVVILGFTAILGSFPTLFEYYSSRLAGSENDNLSRLVYLQGWECAYSAITSTNGLGVGFQNLGVEPDGPSTILIRALFGSDLNRPDGGFLAAKIIGEFGAFGVGLVLYFAVRSIKSFFWLRRSMAAKQTQDFHLVFLHSVIFIFLVELFVRGVGYFSPTFFLFLWALGRLAFLQKQQRIVRREQQYI